MLRRSHAGGSVRQQVRFHLRCTAESTGLPGGFVRLQSVRSMSAALPGGRHRIYAVGSVRQQVPDPCWMYRLPEAAVLPCGSV